jgi:hypothetical protein
MNKLTLQQIAEELDGNFWEAGNKKRVYLSKGYNTKKMTTKTYIYEKEDGTFGISVYIDCPSQDYNWIKSQKEKIEKEVEQELGLLVQEEVFVIKSNDNYIDCIGDEDTLEEAEKFINEKFANEFIKEYDLENVEILKVNNQILEVA